VTVEGTKRHELPLLYHIKQKQTNLPIYLRGFMPTKKCSSPEIEVNLSCQ